MKNFHSIYAQEVAHEVLPMYYGAKFLLLCSRLKRLYNATQHS